MSGPLHQFDIAALSVYLAERIEGFGEITSIEKFSRGQSNPTYRLVTDAKNYVLRAKPPGKLLKSAHQVDREYRVMSALANTDVAVPKTYCLSDENSPIDTMFFVMEMVEGRIFWDPALPELSNRERTKIYASMGHTLATLHDIDPAAVGLADFGRSGNYFARQVNRWSKQYRAAELEPVADVDWLIKWLNEHLVDDDGAVAIVHGDYRIDNMIFGAKRTELLAVLDWELCTLGHPMADVAYQSMQWRLPNSGGMRGLGEIDRAALGIPSEQGYLAAYCERRNIEAPADWSFYLVFSYFRLLSIIQGVLRRAVDGNASNPGSQVELRNFVSALAYDARRIAGCE